MRRIAASVLGPLVATAALTGCGGTNSNTATTANAATSTANSTASTPHPTAVSEGLSGYGATDAAWNAHHQPDTRFAPGAAYDPDPSVARGDLRHDARYYGVVHGGPGGRVNQYYMRFAPRTTVDEARRSVLASEFPPGTSVRDFKTLDSCAILVVHSGKFNGITPNGDASVEFWSGAADETYDASNVWDAIVTFGGLTEC